MRGWIIDCYADTKDDSMVLWLWTGQGVRKIVDRKFRPAFFVWAPEEKMAELRSGLRIAGIGEQTRGEAPHLAGGEEAGRGEDRAGLLPVADADG